MSFDELDLAYFAFGVHVWLHDHSLDDESDRAFTGELEFVDVCLKYAPLLDVPMPDDGFYGVFAYEVAEPFGVFVAEQLATHGVLDTQAAKQQVETLIAAMEPSDAIRT